MINEEIANKVVSIEINVLKATYQEILNNINKLHHRSKQHGSESCQSNGKAASQPIKETDERG